MAAEEISPLVRTKDGRTEIRCPHCEEWQDVLAYKNFETRGKFARYLNAILKCMRCRHAFSPQWLNAPEEEQHEHA